jgi:hypothetical protein
MVFLADFFWHISYVVTLNVRQPRRSAPTNTTALYCPASVNFVGGTGYANQTLALVADLAVCWPPILILEKNAGLVTLVPRSTDRMAWHSCPANIKLARRL